MSRLVRKSKDYLLLLSKSAKRQLKPLITLADKDQVKAIKELVVNLLHGNIPLSPRQKAKLACYKKVLRNIAGRIAPPPEIIKRIAVIVQLLIIIQPFLQTL